MIEQFKQSAAFIRQQVSYTPQIMIILGSGLGGLVNKIENQIVIPYEKIPNFPVSTVEGHAGRLVFGDLGGKKVMAMQGRFHYYEGYSMYQVTFPVRVAYFLGVKILIVSNAAGGLNPKFRKGDLMIITDHINNFPEHPLRGKNYDDLGVRFPEMSKVYEPEYIEIAEKIAKENNIKIQKGIYIGSSGPTLETPAEYRMFRLWGADATGMSTVPEVIVAHHQGMKVFGMSVITNVAEPEDPNEKTTHEEVQNVAGMVEPMMTKLIEELIKRI